MKNWINNYQHSELKRLLNSIVDPNLITVAGCPSLEDSDKPMTIYKVDELLLQLKQIENNIKL